MRGNNKKYCSPCQKIFIGFGSFLAVCIAIMGTMTIYSYAVQPKASDVVLQHLNDLKDNDVQSAYKLTSVAFKRNTRLVAFEKFVNINSALKTISEIEILNQVNDDHDAQISGYITCIHGHHIPFDFTLIKELDEWKITNIEVDNTTHSESMNME